MAVRFKQLSKTSTEWTSLNPTLLEGEIGFEKDTKKIKVGDGITAWTNLDYVIGNSGGTIIPFKNTEFKNTAWEGSNIDYVYFNGYDSHFMFTTNETAIKNDSELDLNHGFTFYGNEPYFRYSGTSNDGTWLTLDAIGGFDFTVKGGSPAADYTSKFNIRGSKIEMIQASNTVTLTKQGFTLNNKQILTEDTGILKQQGTENVGKILKVDSSGNLNLADENIGTKKYLHRIKLNLSDQVSGTAPTKMAVIHLDYYSEQETAYTNPNFATIALANSIRCSGYYTDTDTSLTEKNFVYEIALPQSNEFVLNSSFSITTQSTGSSITDEVVGYIFS